MNDTPKANSETDSRNAGRPRGLLARLIGRLDDAIKRKADANARNGCCCRSEGSGDDSSCRRP